MSVYCISYIQNAQPHKHRACWACPCCELGICEWWHWLVPAIFAGFWPLHTALLVPASSKAGPALQLFPPCYWISADSKAPVQPWGGPCTQHHKPWHPPLFLTEVQCSRRWRTRHLRPACFCSTFPFIVVAFFFVCWLILLVLLSWFGFHFPSSVSSRPPTVCLEGGYSQNTAHIGQSSCLLQWGQIYNFWNSASAFLLASVCMLSRHPAFSLSFLLPMLLPPVGPLEMSCTVSIWAGLSPGVPC